MVDMTPVPNAPGTFAVDWTAEKPGSYLAEVTAQGSGTQTAIVPRRNWARMWWRSGGGRSGGELSTEQNREMLEKLSAETGGRYWKPDELERLPKEISYSEAGISVRDTKELWDMPVVFLVLLGLVAADWLLRRKWGVV